MAKISKIQTNLSLGEVSPRMYGRVDSQQYSAALQTCLNFITHHLGGVFRRPGSYYIAALDDMTHTGGLIPFVYDEETSYMLEFTDSEIRFYKNQSIIVSGMSPYTISSPYSIAEVKELDYTQSFNYLIITHPNHAPKQLVRNSDTDWDLEDIEFNEYPYMDINNIGTTVTPSATSGNITVTSSGAIFTSTDVGRAIRIKSGPTSTNTISYPGDGTQQYFSIPFFPNDSSNVDVYLDLPSGVLQLLTYTSGSPTTNQYTITNGQVKVWAAVDASQLLVITERNAGTGTWGWGIITGYTSVTSVSVAIKSPIENTNATTFWRLGSWSITTGYPAKTTMFEQRLWFANTTSQPNGLWGSQINNLINFSPDDVNKTGNIASDTAIQFIVASPGIQWILGTQALIVGALNGIYQFIGASGAISGLSFFERKDLSVPASPVKPITAHNTAIYVEHLQSKAHSLTYMLNYYGFQQQQINAYAEHLVGNDKIIKLAYTQAPNNIIWMLTDTGTLISCTYRPDQGLIGWARHNVGGNGVQIEDIAAIPGASYDELWLLVKRTVNSGTVRYVEVLQHDFKFGEDITSAFFVDSGLSYSGSPISTFTGLTHLIGETVSVLADGMVHPDCLVNDIGTITLNDSYSVVHAGLGYKSQLQTLPLEGGGPIGTSQDAIARVISLGLRLYETVGLRYGTSFTAMNRLTFRDTSDNIGEAIPPFSGDYIFKSDTGYQPNYWICLEQDQPLPATILAIVFKAEVNEYSVG